MLAEVVVAVDGLPAEVAHEGAAAARHSVAAFRLDETRRTVMALPDAGRRHPLLAAAQDINTSTCEFTQHQEQDHRQIISDQCDNRLLRKQCAV